MYSVHPWQREVRSAGMPYLPGEAHRHKQHLSSWLLLSIWGEKGQFPERQDALRMALCALNTLVAANATSETHQVSFTGRHMSNVWVWESGKEVGEERSKKLQFPKNKMSLEMKQMGNSPLVTAALTINTGRKNLFLFKYQSYKPCSWTWQMLFS